jgi:hypothetical protein
MDGVGLNSPDREHLDFLGGKDERQNKELIKPNKPLPDPHLSK